MSELNKNATAAVKTVQSVFGSNMQHGWDEKKWIDIFLEKVRIHNALIKDECDELFAKFKGFKKDLEGISSVKDIAKYIFKEKWEGYLTTNYDKSYLKALELSVTKANRLARATKEENYKKSFQYVGERMGVALGLAIFYLSTPLGITIEEAERRIILEAYQNLSRSCKELNFEVKYLGKRFETCAVLFQANHHKFKNDVKLLKIKESEIEKYILFLNEISSYFS